MGLPRMIAMLLMEIAKSMKMDSTLEEKKKFIDIVEAKQGKGGFCEVRCAIACPCGVPIPIHASPMQMSDEQQSDMEREIEGDPDSEVIRVQGPDAKPGDKHQIATNLGHTSVRCYQCGALFIVGWELDVCQINKDTVIPWSDSESPKHSSSEPHFSAAKRVSRTVH